MAMETLNISDGTTMQITRLPDIDDETWGEASGALPVLSMGSTTAPAVKIAFLQRVVYHDNAEQWGTNNQR